MSQRSLRARDNSAYLAQDTIAAIASAVGGAIAIVRVSGPRALDAISLLCHSEDSYLASSAQPRKLTRVRLRDSHGELDDALFVRFPGPNSYTGEDLVELHIHGGPYTATRLLEALDSLGIRQALPGEFSFRAVRNGKMSLSQAEAVADLIAASNDGAVSLALEKISGTQNMLLAELADGLRKLSSLGEIGIDFSDQDIDEVSLPRLKERLRPFLETLGRLHSSFDRGTRLQDGIRIAFIGLPNAGKSSFFNALLGEDRSIVSEIAGTTRDVIREKVTLRGKRSSVTLRLEDTAGLRSASNPIERMGIDRTRQSAREAELLLFLLDASPIHETGEVEVSPEIIAAHKQWSDLGSPADRTIGVLTKCDLASGERIRSLQKALQGFGIQLWLETSALTGAGITEAAQAIAEHCGHLIHRDQGEVLLTRLDHARAVASAIEHLERAVASTEIELFAADVRQALHSLSPLIGDTLPDDILGQIFSEFCIGK